MFVKINRHFVFLWITFYDTQIKIEKITSELGCLNVSSSHTDTHIFTKIYNIYFPLFYSLSLTHSLSLLSLIFLTLSRFRPLSLILSYSLHFLLSLSLSLSPSFSLILSYFFSPFSHFLLLSVHCWAISVSGYSIYCNPYSCRSFNCRCW